jgi:hypothetical protein
MRPASARHATLLDVFRILSEEEALILVLCSPGHIATAVADAVAGLDERARYGDPTSDLVSQANGCRAIVYAPAPRLLDAGRRAPPDAERLREIHRAARVAGVERVVVIEPASHRSRFREPRDRTATHARARCTTVRCAPLLDELADVTNLHTARAVWLRRGFDVELTSRAALTQSLRTALLWGELRGETVTVPSQTLEIVEAMQRAAAIAGAAVRIRATAPTFTLAMRKVYAWLGRATLEVEAVCDRLVQERPSAI